MNNSNNNRKIPPAHERRESFIWRWRDGQGGAAKDWSLTPLGPIESWPPSLYTAVSLGIELEFPIALGLGASSCPNIYDGYWAVLWREAPTAMGQDFSQCWESAFPVIGDRVSQCAGGYGGLS